ncbi:MAG: tRNA uridine(34) 5-carboxymethylaminomethyl modification radical SAM/GNAT enzyme Elp3 [Candidatus Diapherotrites archaeon]|nr:tRNA uridine(34) 5-carboxymethylaminomethyl modification radical SAM/GNAT enzyme Elp3 [Candidatus Diapherotrites archaeon]
MVFEELKREILSGKIRTRAQLERRKKQLCKEYGIKRVPQSAEILEKIGVKSDLLLTKPSRSLSGVSVIAIMTKPQPCPGECIYCPKGDAAQSYTGMEPAALRARRAKFSAFKQTQDRLKQLDKIGHPTSKIELIIMGGTFTAMPKNYQENFVLNAFNALNGKESNTIAEAHKLNEQADHRCIGLTFEVRPDYSKEGEINSMLSFGATRVELGVQTIYNDIYRKIKRGHTVEDVVEATQLLKDSFLKVGYHIMPGLPFSSKEKDLKVFQTIFSDDKFKPDMLKVYPCLLAKKEFYDEKRRKEIFGLYESGDWKPLSNDEAVELLADAERYFPKWVRVMRIQRDIPKPYIEAGVTAGNLRELVHRRAKELGIRCKCIRCREIKDKKPEKVKLLREDYEASGGTEIFLSFEDVKNDWLVALLRLRVPYKPFRPEITEGTLGVRELHVYGPEVALGEEAEESQQHKGYGKWLLDEAERIAREEFNAKKLLVMSGIGAREYYRHLGYVLEGAYMGKDLKD